MAQRNAQRGNGFTARLLKARADISASLVQAMNETGMSHESAARSMSVNARTVGAWARGERPATVEVIMASPRLAKAFRRSLCTEHHDPLPYVARKRRSAR